ncbi:MAG TPA: GAF domain-containing protein [Chryseolinea sp.]|nr:GAF domain-containing protein [Chryseolinea sp.]
MKRFFVNNWITLIITLAFVISTVMAIRNGYVIDHNHKLLRQTELVKLRTQQILSDIMHGADLGVRGYGLTKDEKLLNPFNKTLEMAPGIFHDLDSLLKLQDYENRADLNKVKAEVDAYIMFSHEMIADARIDDMATFTNKLKEDRGFNVWEKYAEFSKPLFAYQDQLNARALYEYQWAIRANLILQLAILALVLPLVYFFVAQVQKERRRRKELLKEVDVTDRTFVFDDGKETSQLSEDINERSIDHIKQASSFIASIMEGKYDVTWGGLTSDNDALNKTTLAGNLIQLRENLKKVRQEDERRNWVNEGIAKFSEIMRNHQNQSSDFFVQAISFLVNYVKAQQGSLFVAQVENEETILKLEACYAYDKRKWVEKNIPVGSGLIGQAYLEGTPVILNEVPAGYLHITSGLGQALPRNIVIIPMMHNEQTIAVAEFASFDKLEAYQVQFLVRIGEYFASSISNTSTTKQMKGLLEEAGMREQQMKQREEELRQNMEELQAIQEEMERKQKDVKYQPSQN